MVERGVVRNVSVGSMIPHGENLTLECIDLYEPAHGLATFTCNNGTWNVIPRCEPGIQRLAQYWPQKKNSN